MFRARDLSGAGDMDGRDKPGHDVVGFAARRVNFSIGTLARLAIRAK